MTQLPRALQRCPGCRPWLQCCSPAATLQPLWCLCPGLAPLQTEIDELCLCKQGSGQLWEPLCADMSGTQALLPALLSSGKAAGAMVPVSRPGASASVHEVQKAS